MVSESGLTQPLQMVLELVYELLQMIRWYQSQSSSGGLLQMVSELDIEWEIITNGIRAEYHSPSNGIRVGR